MSKHWYAAIHLVYLGGEHPLSREERKAHFDSYRPWLMSIGDAVVSPAVPLKDILTVQPDGSPFPGTRPPCRISAS